MPGLGQVDQLGDEGLRGIQRLIEPSDLHWPGKLQTTAQ